MYLIGPHGPDVGTDALRVTDAMAALGGPLETI